MQSYRQKSLKLNFTLFCTVLIRLKQETLKLRLLLQLFVQAEHSNIKHFSLGNNKNWVVLQSALFSNDFFGGGIEIACYFVRDYILINLALKYLTNYS